MFQTLHSRLLLAFSAVITMVLVVVVISLLFLSNLPRTVTLKQNAERLMRANRAVVQEFANWRKSRNELEYFERILERIAREQEVRILLVDGQNNIVFDTDGQWETRPFNTQVIPTRQLNNISLLGPLQLSRYRPPDEGMWLVLTSDIRWRQNQGRLVIGVLEPNGWGTFQQFFLRPLLQAACVSLLLAALLAVWITRSIARPLGKLATAAEAIAQGNYEYRVIPEGPREVSSVATSFNAMAAQVQQTNQAQRDFVANVSHDLKTPLTSIQGWSQALIEGAARTAVQQEKAATIIHTESERMGRLVNQLLDMARLESGQFELYRDYLNLNSLVQRVAEQVKLAAAQKEIDLTVIVPSEPLICYGDPDRLMQIFNNLLDNALQHTQLNGQIVISLTPADNQLALITVVDNGAGIPAADLDRVFERFYQVDKSRTRQGKNGQKQSIGLGLAIVKQLVEAHGGRVAVSSVEGEGSKFEVYLPLAKPKV